MDRDWGRLSDLFGFHWEIGHPLVMSSGEIPTQ